jgi:hypothetical protein
MSACACCGLSASAVTPAAYMVAGSHPLGNGEATRIPEMQYPHWSACSAIQSALQNMRPLGAPEPFDGHDILVRFGTESSPFVHDENFIAVYRVSS